jgi:RimJ/RimL family protein N-acetyltransferase
VAEPEIIPITEAHAEGFNKAVDFVARERKYLSVLEGFSFEDSLAFVRKNINESNPHFVVVDDEQVVGWCDITPSDRGNSRHAGTLGIGLLPPYRGRGLGKPLMQAAIEAGWQRFERIELTVNGSNRNAISLYLSLGFAIEGCKRRAVLIDGQYIDLYVMGILRGN